MVAANCIAGTQGYTRAVSRFTAATIAIDFSKLHGDFLEFIPPTSAHILDVGAGIGRDASVLARMGHRGVVEPTTALLVWRGDRGRSELRSRAAAPSTQPTQPDPR